MVAHSDSEAELVYEIVSDELSTGKIELAGTDHSMVTIKKAGQVKIKALVTESTNHLSGDRTITLTIAKQDPLIVFNDLFKTLGDEPFHIERIQLSQCGISIQREQKTY